MPENFIKLFYNPSRLRINLIFNAGYCLHFSKPPTPSIVQAKRKMEQEKFVGNIDYYVIYEQRLSKVWENIRKSLTEQQIASNFEVVLTIAAGKPKLEGLKVFPSSDPNTSCYITIDAPIDKIKTWRVSWIKLAIEEQLKLQGIEEINPNPAHVHGAWFKATQGIKIKEYPILKCQYNNQADNTKPYTIIFNKNRSEIVLIVNSSQYLTTKKYISEMLNVTYAAINKLSTKQNIKIEFLKDNLTYSLLKASQDKERFGIELPLVLLAGVFCNETSYSIDANKQKEITPTKKLSKQDNVNNTLQYSATEEKYPGRGLLQVNVIKNGMEAYIKDFNPDWYNDENLDINIEWLQKELLRLGIKHGFEKHLPILEAKIKQRENLDGLLIASGTPPVEGRSPYLYASYKDPNIDNEKNIIDMREFQQRRIVKRGQLIAEIKYSKPPVVGYDVYGHEIIPGPGEGLDVKIDDNVEVRGSGKFYAKIDGVPSIQDNSISISKALVHEGDVNLRTGNIHFDGPVEIKGAIDNGAVVEVTGDLIVHGIIRGALVKVGGNLEARGGIVTGYNGKVYAKCDIITDYIENSNIVAGGNIIVKKIILNSRCVAGGYIQADTREGVIAGGKISCRGNLTTAKLGFPKGALTEVNVGMDAKSQLAVQIRTMRLEKVIAKANEDRLALRELSRKKEAQKTKKHIEKMEELKRRLTKSRELIEKMQKHLTKAKANVKYYPESKIFVYDVLTSNCKIEIAGVPIPVLQDVAEVQISCKRSRGSFIQPLEKSEAKNVETEKKQDKTTQKKSADTSTEQGNQETSQTTKKAS